MTPEEHVVLQRLTITVTTLISAVAALIETHPNQAEAKVAFAKIAERDFALELGHGYEEEVLEFAQSLRLRFLSIGPG